METALSTTGDEGKYSIPKISNVYPSSFTACDSQSAMRCIEVRRFHLRIFSLNCSQELRNSLDIVRTRRVPFKK